MQHKDYVKAAKELNKVAELTIKVVAVKGDVLKKAIRDAVKSLTNFDFSILSSDTLDVFDDLKCEMSEDIVRPLTNSEIKEITPKLKKDNIIPIKKETPKERTVFQQGPALLSAAADVIDVLGYPANVIEKLQKMALMDIVKELQKMANEINMPYEEEGKQVTPNDKPDDFKPDTIKVFADNNITVNWKEEEVEKKKKITKKKADKGKATEEGKGTTKKESIGKKKPELQFHEYANLFPETDEKTVSEIVKDMNENGFRPDRPVILFGGKIADGRTRHKAASIAGVDAIYINFDGTKEQLFKHVIALNLKRRHLTPAQRATLATELLPEFEKAGKAKQKAGGKGKKTDKAFRATEEAAKATGSTAGAVSTVKSIKKKDPKKFEEMKKGKKTIAAAKRETEEKTAVEKAESSEKIMKAKLKKAQTAIHDYIDAAELAEIKIANVLNSITLIADTIQKVIS